MQEFTLELDNVPDLVFEGEQIAEADTRTADSTRWVEIKVFRTNTDPERWVVWRKYKSKWEGESSTSEAEVFHSDEEILHYLGYSDLAKQIYKHLGIDARQRIT